MPIKYISPPLWDAEFDKLSTSSVPLEEFVEAACEDNRRLAKVLDANLLLLLKEWRERISLLKETYGYTDDEAAEADLLLSKKFAKASKDAPGLPPNPKRDYRPREGIIEYIKADDGLGPWLKAGVLTRPLIKRLSPSGYTALSNWLRQNDLPTDVQLPTKTEIVATRSIDHEAMREARRLSSLAHRTKRHQV